MQTCIDLRACFGRRYRVVRGETYTVEHGRHGRTDDPWHDEIRCRFGCIYPHGGSTLAASVDGHPNVAGQMRRLRCCRVHQDGDFGELTALFDVADFAQVARILRPRRRRQVSPEQRAAMTARLHGKVAPQRPIEGQPAAQGRPPRTADDSQVVLQQTALF